VAWSTVRIRTAVTCLMTSITACSSTHSLMTCGDASRSAGPDAVLAILTLTAPSTGRSGSTMNMQATLTASADLDDLSTPAAVEIRTTS
jgi:hypothetical protein